MQAAPILSLKAIYFTLLLVFSAQAWGANYWVAFDGDDADAGTKEKPFLTVQKAADTMRPGDTCTVRGGTYRETVTVRRSGTEDRRAGSYRRHRGKWIGRHLHRLFNGSPIDD